MPRIICTTHHHGAPAAGPVTGRASPTKTTLYERRTIYFAYLVQVCCFCQPASIGIGGRRRRRRRRSAVATIHRVVPDTRNTTINDNDNYKQVLLLLLLALAARKGSRERGNIVLHIGMMAYNTNKRRRRMADHR